MAMIQREDIKKLANLARIKIDESEEEQLVGDIEGILSYIGSLNEVKVDPSNYEYEDGLKNVMREDDVPEEIKDVSRGIIEEAPVAEGGYIIVKKIL